MKQQTLIDKVLFLKKTPLFESLDLDLLLPIADKLVTTTFDEGEVIFSFKDEAQRIYFILDGIVEIIEPDGTVVANLSDYDFFGDESLFNEKPRGYTAISKKESCLLSLSRQNLMAIIFECPWVAIGLLGVYAASNQFRERKVIADFSLEE